MDIGRNIVERVVGVFTIDEAHNLDKLIDKLIFLNHEAKKRGLSNISLTRHVRDENYVVEMIGFELENDQEYAYRLHYLLVEKENLLKQQKESIPELKSEINEIKEEYKKINKKS